MERDWIPKAGDIVKHFKGKEYKILAAPVLHSETEELLICYQALYSPYKIFARPYDMFLEEVDHDKYPDVQQKYRLEKIEYE